MGSTADVEPAQAALRIADELAVSSTRLRRVLRRAVRHDWPYELLPRTQIELLSLVGERPGIGVTEAAVELRLAANTVSTLVNELRLGGLLVRESDTVDRRVARLSVSAAGAARLAAWRDRRAELLAAALTDLTDRDRAALAAGLPALERLIAGLESETA